MTTKYVSHWVSITRDDICKIEHDATMITPGERKEQVRARLLGQVKLQNDWSSPNFDEIVDRVWADKMAEKDKHKSLKLQRLQQLTSKT